MLHLARDVKGERGRVTNTSYQFPCCQALRGEQNNLQAQKGQQQHQSLDFCSLWPSLELSWMCFSS